MKAFFVLVATTVFFGAIYAAIPEPSSNINTAPIQTVETTVPLSVDNKLVVEAVKPIKPISYKIVLPKVTEEQMVLLTNFEAVSSVSAARVIDEIQKKSKNGKELYLLLESPGGSVFDGTKIISAMEASPVKVNTVTIGMCASMCAMIHQHGATRMMFNRSMLMFHPAAGGVMGTLEQMRSRLDFVTRSVEKMNRTVANRVHLSYDEFKSLYLVEMWIDAEDSLAKKLTDQIVYFDVPAAALKQDDGMEDKTRHKFFELTD